MRTSQVKNLPVAGDAEQWVRKTPWCHVTHQYSAWKTHGLERSCELQSKDSKELNIGHSTALILKRC